ncbi:AAA family ATPase [Burkholderia gladioli pv. gladioli]|uniref:AAA family ATPase n=1 Tax=Burkholderia gladioli TaxID=28095 RepID=UPI0024BD1853|nr:AAA family ATPase [Burkholderia gladioli]MDJ1162960.1 AAA family ATPase [Burkholderia gladioli pv. gladioli]
MSDFLPSNTSARSNPHGTGVIVESAQNIPIHSPEPIWKNWLYRAKVHLLAGPPSSGKTTLALDIAAILSSGGVWPDGTSGPRGRVLIWSSEDGIEDTVMPRLVAAGADLANVEVLRQTEEKWLRRPFDPTRDLSLLEEKISQFEDVALVIVDSIADLMPGSPGNNSKVRKSLLPLVGVADRTGVAVLGLTHVIKASRKKHPLERIIGGVGLGAVVRIAMIVARDDAGGFGAVREWSVLVKAKANICREDGGFLYRTADQQIQTPQGVVESSKIRWGQALPGTAMDILNRAESSEQGGSIGKFQQACDFLVAELEVHPRLAAEVEAKAGQVGISKATLRRAREQLGVVSQKQRGAGSASQYVWSLPIEPNLHDTKCRHGVDGLDVSVSRMRGAPAMAVSPQWPMGLVPGSVHNGGMFPDARGPAFYFPNLSDACLSATGLASFPRSGQVAQPEQPEQPERAVHTTSVRRSQSSDRPAWISEFHWDWLRWDYSNECGKTTRKDDEDEWDFRHRVARYLLEVLCPDWTGHDELARALVDAFDNPVQAPDPGKYF